MTVLLDARPHATAVKAAIAATLGTPNVYDHSQVPATLPDIFVLVSIERRPGDVLRSARAGHAGWRVLTTTIGRTVKECEWAAFKVATALEEQRLTVAATSTTPVQFESATAAKFDDERFVADAFYTYVH